MSIKTTSIVLFAVCAATGLHAKPSQVPAGGKVSAYETVAYVPASPEKMKWWNDAKFGLFVHWGVYSVPGGIWSKDSTFETWRKGDANDLVEVKGYAEQIMKGTQMPIGEYEKLPSVFDWSKFNAKDFINLCFASGQHYIVITSKHHDGFAIWPSKVNQWNIRDATPYGRTSGRDPLKELADACHATKTNGSPWEIKLCFYYSHCAEWHAKGGFSFGYKYQGVPTTEEFQDYLDQSVKPQLTELLTNYGDIGMIWFDVPQHITKDQSQQLSDLVHKLSPNTIIDGRLGSDLGNYVNTGDNGDTGVAVDYPWETGSSINESYGYKINAHDYKTPEGIILKLINVVANGGNYLLNVGPKGDGSIPKEDVDILSEVGKWTKPNGAAIFGTRRTPYFGASSFMPEWGTCTQKGNTLYLFVTRWPKDGKVEVPLLQNKIKQVSFVIDPERKPLSYTSTKDADGNDIVAIKVPETPLQKIATVIAVECEGDHIEMAPYKHAYDASKRQIFLSADSFQAHASSVKDLRLHYDRDEKAIVNWRHNKGRGATVAWTHEVPEAGEYVVEIEYSLQRPHAGVPVDVLIDGKKQFTFTTADTGGYDQYKKVAVGTVKLADGKQDFAFDLNKSDVSRLYVMQLKGVYLTKK